MIDRVSDLTEDLFTADDARIGDTSNAALGPSSAGPDSASPLFRESTTTADGLPLLRTDALKKLVRLLSTVVTQEKGAELLIELEEGGVGRLLKVLERSWAACEGAEAWDASALSNRADINAESPKKKGKGKKKDSPAKSATPGRRSSRSRSPSTAAMSVDAQDDPPESEFWADDALERVSDAARLFSDALLAARCALALLTCTVLPKRLYSADYLASLVLVIRQSTSEFLYPLLTAPPLSHLADLPSLEPEPIAAVCDALTAAIPLLTALVRAEELDDDLVIKTIYFSLSPFFHEANASARGRKEPAGGVAGAMKAIRLGCLGLVRTVFGRYPDQRAWVVQEVLDNLTRLEIAKKGKGSFRCVAFQPCTSTKC